MNKKTHKYNYNIEFFENDSPELAYFLGFLMADGYIGKEITFCIHSKDIKILQYINLLVCKQNLIKYNEVYDKKRDKIYNQVRLSICSKKIIQILIDKYGFTIGAKTGKEFIPNTQYKYDFIRGVFDGDGCVFCVRKTPYLFNTSICSASRKFLEDIKILCNNIGNINCSGTDFDFKMSTFESFQFRNLIYYNDNLFGLERKKQKLLKIDISKLHTSRFYEEETQRLIQLVNNGYSCKEISKILNRKIGVIRSKLRDLGLFKNMNYQYTQENISFIKTNRHMGIKWLVAKLNLPYRSVAAKVYRIDHNV